MEVAKVAKQIEDKIKLLEDGRIKLQGAANDKATFSAMYDLAIAKTLIMLENGKSFELEGQAVKNPPKSIMEKIAKGICWEEKLKSDQADTTYKAVISKMNAIQAELNGYQSIYKHLETV